MQNNVNDELPSTEQVKLFEQILHCPYRLYSDETLKETDYINLYKYIMNKFKENKEGFDIKDSIFEVRDYLETFPIVQEYMCAVSENDEVVIEEIITKLEQRKRDKKNPFKQFIRSLKG